MCVRYARAKHPIEIDDGGASVCVANIFAGNKIGRMFSVDVWPLIRSLAPFGAPYSARSPRSSYFIAHIYMQVRQDEIFITY